jgi:hypothetical protein
VGAPRIRSEFVERTPNRTGRATRQGANVRLDEAPRVAERTVVAALFRSVCAPMALARDTPVSTPRRRGVRRGRRATRTPRARGGASTDAGSRSPVKRPDARTRTTGIGQKALLAASATARAVGSVTWSSLPMSPRDRRDLGHRSQPRSSALARTTSRATHVRRRRRASPHRFRRRGGDLELP